MPQCYAGPKCELPQAPLIGNHHCLAHQIDASSSNANWCHSLCAVQVIRRGNRVVLKISGNDNRLMFFSDLTSFGQDEVHNENNPGAGSDYSEICKKCWESKASVRNVTPPATGNPPADLVAEVMSDWLNGCQTGVMVINQLRQHYGESKGADPKSAAYFQREFIESASQHARGGRGGQSRGSQQHRGRNGGATSTNSGGWHQQQQQPSQPSDRLTHLRANFTPAGVKKKSRAESTFSKHQSCNERFILWLFEERPKYLVDELRHKLDDIKAEVDYSTVTLLMVSKDVFLLVGDFLLSYPYQLCTSTGTVETKVITFLQ